MQPINWHEIRERVLRMTPSVEQMWRDLEPTLTSGELDDLQQQIGAELPNDYQQFLLHVGRGGPGPSYGITPVGKVEGRWAWRGEGYEHRPVNLADPFPLRTSDWRVQAELEAAYPDWFAFATQANYEAAVQTWHDRHDSIVFDPRRTYGAIPICEEGCGLRALLIVTGPERGHIWLDHRADGRGLTPAWLPHHPRITFAQWYRDWIERQST
ncbi:SMI1/KNR4 family protein [Micromonospora yasonensis]|uniref:SMI1/KNR4 family protein n=1 Tax=Micromonospora yasonensis TaxID=1128667 RepID=UPI00222FE03B|nr:SMI1/KNR4 family protein [Micromonospora yasonensis]MCW3839475.1 SMI1/KNR4 family protein [Micromonospora yasonensis]